MNPSRIILLCLALLALLIAGCGGDDGDEDSSDTETSEALSSEDYTQEAQNVLLAFGTSFQELGAQISASQEPEEFGSLVDQAESEIQTAIDEFGAITPPEEAQEGHDQVLAALEDFSSKLTDVSEAADAGDDSALQEAATALQEAGFEFQDQITQATQSLQDSGIEIGGSPEAPPEG